MPNRREARLATVDNIRPERLIVNQGTLGSREPTLVMQSLENHGDKKLNLQAEHGVDPGSRSLGRRRSAFKRRKGRLLVGWRRSHMRLHGRLIRGGSRGRNTRL